MLGNFHRKLLRNLNDPQHHTSESWNIFRSQFSPINPIRYFTTEKERRKCGIKCNILISFSLDLSQPSRKWAEKDRAEIPPRDTFYQRVLLGYRIHLVHTWIRNSTRRKEEERERERWEVGEGAGESGSRRARKQWHRTQPNATLRELGHLSPLFLSFTQLIPSFRSSQRRRQILVSSYLPLPERAEIKFEKGIRV